MLQQVYTFTIIKIGKYQVHVIFLMVYFTVSGMRYLESKNCIHRDLGNYAIKLNGVKMTHSKL